MLRKHFNISGQTLAASLVATTLLYVLFSVIQPVGSALAAALLQAAGISKTVPPYLNYRSSAHAVHVDATGRVGVGTTSPQAQLQISATTGSALQVNAGGQQIVMNSSGLYLKGGLYLRDANNPDMMLDLSSAGSAQRADYLFGVDGQPRTSVYYDKSTNKAGMVHGNTQLNLYDNGLLETFGSLGVNGVIHSTSNLWVDGDFVMGQAARKPIKIVRISNLPENVGPVFPNVLAGDYDCTVGGWSTGIYDMNENGNGINKAWTYIADGWWWVRSNFLATTRMTSPASMSSASSRASSSTARTLATAKTLASKPEERNPMSYQSKRLWIWLLLLALLLPMPAQAVPTAQITGSTDTDMRGSDGCAITAGGLSTVGDFAQAGSQLSLAPKGQPPALLARQDYQKVYDNANALLTAGVTFRRTELQLPPSCKTVDECQLNYENFNNGELFFSFCTNYKSVDARGYCAGDNPASWPQPSTQIRGPLVRAREMFGFLALAEPPDILVLVNGAPTNVRTIGRSGVLSATREIANIHMIFGNEFMVDALDYRFAGGDPRADQIIAEELAQLEKARQQFDLAVGVLAHAFNADFGGPNGGYIGDYFGEREFGLFGIVSERMVLAIGEMADRYRQLGEDAQALDLYASAFATQYVQAMALATSAAQQNAKFLENGGFEIINNLETLRAQAQTLHEGINPFGFVDEYVPLQTWRGIAPAGSGRFRATPPRTRTAPKTPSASSTRIARPWRVRCKTCASPMTIACWKSAARVRITMQPVWVKVA
ncbi:MAG: hypothetical protein R3E79_58610 [Caldilineaceae bacterium]